MAVVTEGRRDPLQIVARPGAGAANRLQRPSQQLIGLLRQFNGRRCVGRQLGQDRFHSAAVIRKRHLDALERFRCHGLTKLVGDFMDCGFATHRGARIIPQNCDCLGRYMDWNKPVKYESCCSI